MVKNEGFKMNTRHLYQYLTLIHPAIDSVHVGEVLPGCHGIGEIVGNPNLVRCVQFWFPIRDQAHLRFTVTEPLTELPI